MSTPAQITAWAAGAGFTGLDLVTAVAVALASGGDPSRDGGVWALPGAPPGDGAAQAAHARGIQASSGWSAFPAHRSGAYALFMPVAMGVVPTVGVVDTVADAGSDTVRLTKAAGNALEFATDRDSWLRVVKVVVGVVMIAAGLLMIQASITGRVTGAVVRKVSGAGEEVADNVFAFRAMKGQSIWEAGR